MNITPIHLASFETQCVLATCQSLAMLDGELVGDPMEKAAITAIEWNIAKGTYVCPYHVHKYIRTNFLVQIHPTPEMGPPL